MKKKRRTFSRDYKLAAVKKVIELGLSYSEVARDLGIHDTMIHNWRKAFETDGTLKVEVDSNPSVEAELKRLREENRQLKMERDISKKRRSSLQKKMDEARIHLGAQERWPICILCRALEVTRAACYKWLKRKPSKTQKKQLQIVAEMEGPQMKSSIRYACSSLVIASLAASTGIAAVLDDGQTHEIKAEFASLEIRDGVRPTSVTVASDGKVSLLTAYDNSMVRSLGGNLSHARFLDSSVFRAEGGGVSHLHVAAMSEATLSGGIIEHSTAYDEGQIVILGDGRYNFVSALGTLESRGSETADSASQVDIFAGDVGITKAKAGGVVNIHGGSVHSVDQGGGGTFNIHGGSIRHISLDPNSVTNIYGEGLELSVRRLIHDSPVYLLSGTLADGTAATAEIFHFDTSASLNLITVPEPSSLILFALCGTTLLALRHGS